MRFHYFYLCKTHGSRTNRRLSQTYVLSDNTCEGANHLAFQFPRLRSLLRDLLISTVGMPRLIRFLWENM